jgi:hypothetical protein
MPSGQGGCTYAFQFEKQPRKKLGNCNTSAFTAEVTARQGMEEMPSEKTVKF